MTYRPGVVWYSWERSHDGEWVDVCIGESEKIPRSTTRLRNPKTTALPLLQPSLITILRIRPFSKPMLPPSVGDSSFPKSIRLPNSNIQWLLSQVASPGSAGLSDQRKRILGHRRGLCPSSTHAPASLHHHPDRPSQPLALNETSSAQSTPSSMGRTPLTF